MRLRVEHADGADGMTVGRLQQGARIEAQAGVAGDQRISLEARIAARVRDTKEVFLEDFLPAEGALQRRLAHAQADLRLEELAPVADEVDRRDERLAEIGGGFGDLVEVLLARRIQQSVAVECAKAFDLLVAHRGAIHERGRPGRSDWFLWAGTPGTEPIASVDPSPALRDGGCDRPLKMSRAWTASNISRRRSLPALRDELSPFRLPSSALRRVVSVRIEKTPPIPFDDVSSSMGLKP